MDQGGNPDRTEAARSAGYSDLRRDLERPGCAVCRGASRSAWRLIDGILWEGVTDVFTRTRLRRSRGFCREHSFMAIRVADAEHGQLGMAIVYEDLVAQLEDQLRPPDERGRRWRRTIAGLARRSRCPACETARGTETNYLGLLAAAEPASELGRLARAGRIVLCLPHLFLGIELLDDDRARTLVDIALAGTSPLRADLQEFVRKRDYRFSHEPLSPEEADAWRRAVTFLAGEPHRRPPATGA
ncbi:MAG: DUF6062 family protein [Actinomycetota bacterium]